jgi:hypothetical protein
MSSRNRLILLVSIIIAILIANFAYPQTEDKTMCNTGLTYTQEVVVEPKGNVLVIQNPEMDAIFILAFDWNRDGIYESLLFDINGNGMVDLQLEYGQATAEQVLELYCLYQQLEMVMGSKLHRL